jgi:hypothetical protein
VGTSTITSSDSSGLDAAKIQLQKNGKIVMAGDGFDGNGNMTNAKLTLDGTATSSNPMINSDNFKLNYDGSAVLGKLNIGSNGSIESSDNSFSISETGAATFAGTLSAPNGSFGSVFIEENGSLTIDKIVIDNSGIKATVVVEVDEVAQSVVKFNLDSTTGLLTAVDADITGTITATSGSFTGSITSTSGTIGGFDIGESDLTAGTGTTSVGVSTGSTSFFAGNATPTEAPFRVTNEGALTATNATITGAITATSGSFTGSIASTSGTIGG